MNRSQRMFVSGPFAAALRVTAFAALGAVAPGVSVAQTDTTAADASPALEEVLVTARKREESLNAVPISVTAFSANRISALGLSTMNDVSKFTPGLHFQNQTGGNSGRNDRTFNTLIFRGLALTNDIGTRAGGLLFVDGAPIIGAAAPGLSDIERVEVLRGPQSAFFGRSTFSGAVNYVTKDPPESLLVTARVTGASFGSHTEQLSIGGPLVGDTLRGRLSAFNEVQGGYWDNAAQPDEEFGERRTTSIGGQLLWAPSDAVRVKAAVTAFVNDDGPPAQAAIKQPEMNCNLNPATVPSSLISNPPLPGDPQVPNPNAGNRYFCGEIPDADRLPPSTISGNYVIDPLSRATLLENSQNFPTFFESDFVDHPGMRREALQSSVRFDWTLPSEYSLSLITAFHTEKFQTLLDLAFRDARALPNPLAFIPGSSPNVKWYLTFQSEFRNLSQEIRLTSPQERRLRWLVGLNYIDAKEYDGAVWGQTPLGAIFTAAENLRNPRTPAAFGAAYFDFTPQWTLSTELRYQTDKVRQDALTTTTGVPLVPVVRLEEDFDSVSPRVTLDYKPREGTLLYALWSKGSRPGGFNSALSPDLGAGPQLLAAAAGGGYTLSYDEEEIDNYEIGVKTRLFDDRVQLNAGVYYDEYTKGQIAQTVTFTTASGTLNQLQLIKNVGEIELRGVEIEAQWAATDRLQFSTTYAFNDSEIKNGFCSDCGFIYSASDGTGAVPANNDLTGKRLPIAPRTTATLGGEYAAPLTGDYEWFARADYRYRGRMFIDQANVASIGDKQTVDVRFGVRTGRLNVEVFCTNCTDDLTAESAVFGQTDLLTITAPPVRQEIRYGLPLPRMYGVTLEYRFGAGAD